DVYKRQLLYSLLHLSGYDMPLSELQAFRQWESRTPGHPEYGVAPGIETTTGPLGQGCGNAVGMALAERMLAERFNTSQFAPIDHYTYAICSDGDLMEGVSHEAFSLAGHLGLNKLIVFYDSNGITIEGPTRLTYSEDVRKRFQAYNWRVLEIDGHDPQQIDLAIRTAKRERYRPTLVITHTHIGHGSPNKHDTAAAHGEPLGEAEVLAAKQNLGLPPDHSFYVPERVRTLFLERLPALERREEAWRTAFVHYCEANPEKARMWRQFFADMVPENLLDVLPSFSPGQSIATRSASAKVLQEIARLVPQLVGGAADLAPSTRTIIENGGDVGPGTFAGRNLRFGVREHAMCAILNGMALHGGLRVFGSTFFVFLDYCRPAVRLAALMKLPIIYIFTHDSIFVGEDGPTHQPVEHLATLRALPGMTTIRPADAAETAVAWAIAMRNKKGPTALVLTRQNVPVLDRTFCAPARELEKGGYILWQNSDGQPDAVLIASGSEVSVALEAAKKIASRLRIRVVNLGSWELFEAQPEEYRKHVLPPACPTRVAVEAASPFGWDKYIGPSGLVVALNRYGASAPYQVLAEKFGFTADNIASITLNSLRQCTCSSRNPEAR
ncbi:MAG: transketolase, partial [Kiritimatiellae bacterium]|nr:transketolase [Kiritimatiellia bacterium]